MDLLDRAQQVCEVVGQLRQDGLRQFRFPLCAGTGKGASEVIDLLVRVLGCFDRFI